MKIEKEAEEILKKFSKALDNIPQLEETYYLVDNLNREREDISEEKNPHKIIRNAHTDKEGHVVVEKSKWSN